MKIATEKEVLFLVFALYSINIVKPDVWHFKYKMKIYLCFQLLSRSTNIPSRGVSSQIYPFISFSSNIKDDVF